MSERNDESTRKAFGLWAENLGSEISAEPSGRYSHRPSDAVTLALFDLGNWIGRINVEPGWTRSLAVSMSWTKFAPETIRFSLLTIR